MASITMTELYIPISIWENLPPEASAALEEYQTDVQHEDDGWVTVYIGDTKDDRDLRHLSKKIPTFAAVVHFIDSSGYMAYSQKNGGKLFEETFSCNIFEPDLLDDMSSREEIEKYNLAKERWKEGDGKAYCKVRTAAINSLNKIKGGN